MKRMALTFICLCILLSGCGLLPQEAQLQMAPVTPEYEKPTYLFTTVTRGDMLLEQRVSCNYQSAQTESLYFPVEGLYYDAFFVSPGDRVEPGQLLAQVDCADVQKKLDDYQLSVKRLDLQLAAIEEDRSLAQQRQKILLQDASAEELRAALANVNARFDAQRKSLLDEKNLILMEMNGYEQLLPQRKLYAGISGIVTYLYQPGVTERSSADQRIVTITDPDKYIFRMSTDKWDLFPDGQEFVVESGGEAYTVTAVPASELGLSDYEKVEGKTATVYLRLHSPAPELTDGASGVVVVQLASRENILTLPEKAVDTINGQTVVYYLDELGLKNYKPVETGLKTGGKIEIVSGLVDGEQVIIG